MMKLQPLISRVELEDELCRTFRAGTRQHALHDMDVIGSTRLQQARLGLVEHPQQTVIGPGPVRIFYFLGPRLVPDPRGKGGVGDLIGWKRGSG
jgi:hypothetical protein